MHLLNLDGFDKTIHLSEDERPLLDGRALTLRRRTGLLLPLNMSFGDVRIVYATAEILRVASDALTFRLTQAEDVIALETKREILPSAAYGLERSGAHTLVRSRKHALVDDQLTVRWR